MAYAVDKNDPNSEENQGKINIFGAIDQGIAEDAQKTNGIGGPVNKTTSTGTVESGAGGGMQQSNAPAVQNTPSQTAAAFQKAAATQKIPGSITGIGEAIGRQKSALQAEADAYGAGAQKAATEQAALPSEDVINSAVGGNTEAQAKVSARKNSAAPIPYQTFTPTTDVHAEDQAINELATNKGIGNFLRQSAKKPTYTRGQAAMDASLLMSNPEFAKYRSGLSEQNKALQQQAVDLGASATQSANDVIQKTFSDQTQALLKNLTGKATDIRTAAEAKASAEKDIRNKLDSGKITAAEAQAALQAADDELDKAWGAGYGKNYAATPTDVSGYLNFNQTPDWKEFVEAPEASKYNNILSMLGVPDINGQGMLNAGAGGGHPYEFNTKGLTEKIVADAQAARAADEAKAQGILSGAKGRAESYFSPAAISAAQQQEEAAVRSLAPWMSPEQMSQFIQEHPIDYGNFISKTGESGLTQEDVDTLNAIAGKTGGQTYQYGGPMGINVDTARVQDAYRDILAGLQPHQNTLSEDIAEAGHNAGTSLGHEIKNDVMHMGREAPTKTAEAFEKAGGDISDAAKAPEHPIRFGKFLGGVAKHGEDVAENYQPPAPPSPTPALPEQVYPQIFQNLGQQLAPPAPPSAGNVLKKLGVKK